MTSRTQKIAAKKKQVGAAGEAAVCVTYHADGYTILAQNWECKVGELDLVVKKDELIVFVEVRTVTTDYLATPTLTVSRAKQARVARTADHYLRTEVSGSTNIRFDVVGVRLQKDEDPDVQRLENAFVPAWSF